MKSGCQIYVKGSLEAAELYKRAFNLIPNPEMTAYNEDGTYEHVSLMFGENEIIAIAEGSDDYCQDVILENKCPIMSFNIYGFGTREAIDHAYAVLSENARHNNNPNGPNIAFWDDTDTVYGFNLVDKFGIHWGVLI
jgi:uncharacterized glyoxalase superfamily protein PhnB